MNYAYITTFITSSWTARVASFIKTPWHGNHLHIDGHLSKNSTGQRRISLRKDPQCRVFDIFFGVILNKSLNKLGFAGERRRFVIFHCNSSWHFVLQFLCIANKKQLYRNRSCRILSFGNNYLTFHYPWIKCGLEQRNHTFSPKHFQKKTLWQVTNLIWYLVIPYNGNNLQ